jgi:hypothetical protein
MVKPGRAQVRSQFGERSLALHTLILMDAGSGGLA